MNVTGEKEKNAEGRPREKLDVVPPQQLLQKQVDERRYSTLLQTKGRRANVLQDTKSESAESKSQEEDMEH